MQKNQEKKRKDKLFRNKVNHSKVNKMPIYRTISTRDQNVSQSSYLQQYRSF